MPRLKIFWVICVVLGTTLSNGARADTQMTAETFVQKLADDAISQLTDKSVSLEEQEGRFRGIIEEYIAFKTIARWVLGRYWRSADEAQQGRYLSLFEDLMVATYAHRFQDYGGEKLEVFATRVIDDSQWLVQSRIKRPDADGELKVDWRVRRSSDQFRIIDIMVEGLSMAQTQRSEFSSVLRGNGGDLDAMMNDLEARLQKARAERAGAVHEASAKP